MITKTDRHHHDMAKIQAQPMKIGRTSDALAFPTSLAGTWPSPDGPDRNDLRQVHALDAMITFLTSTCCHTFRSLSFWQSAPNAGVFLGRADLQGRMDLFSRVAGKAKDFIKPAEMSRPLMSNAMSRSRS